ncbi:MAG TPA: TRAP transporter substrate-binding protein DctP, partial [Terriglobia bacterium]|nr:TRAP transporter substrate-binding protein DctP [Terriglobia bacterium]
MALAAGIVFSLIGLVAARAADKPTRVRLATLAPRGTSLHKTLVVMGEKWRSAPCGGVELTIYPDGTMGGEADMVSKMRIGQLQAAMLSVTGLSKIDKSVAALQNMPFTFRSLDEVAYVTDKLRPELERRFQEKGFVVLFWGDVGWVRFFSRKPVARPDDLRRMKLFTWAGDEQQLDLMKHLRFNPVPLETNDILTGLQTGLIDAVPAPPLIALAGQFDGPAQNMLEINYAPLVGGTVITKKAWDSICPDARQALLSAAAEAGRDMTAKSRQESDDAVQAMQKRGLKLHTIAAGDSAEWARLADEVKPQVRGALVP